MAKLIVKSDGVGSQVIQLNLGVNRFGRSPKSDFLIDHPTVSGTHCEIAVREDGLMVRDCGSTNGTFVNGELVQEAALFAGQTLHLGDVELVVESTEVTIAIPQFDVPQPAPPVMLTDGSLVCPRHKHARATHQCTQCREILCDKCLHRLRRKGGKVLKLCPLCSSPCQRIGGEAKPKKKTLLGFFQKTMKLPFLRDRFTRRNSE
jgi:pSer/pThr/pTyr-binding forkhead associated (FHA) protein